MRRLSALILVGLVMLAVGVSVAQQPETDTPSSDAPPLQVVDSLPAHTADLALDGTVVFIFDRPVDCASAQVSLRVEPQTDGQVTCDDEKAALTFTPAEPFARATAYTFTLDRAALTGQDGGQLPGDFALTLNTVGALQVSEVLPVDGSSQIEADGVITVVFNRPVVALVSVDDMDDLPNPLTISPQVEGTGEWLNTSIYMFTPEPAFGGDTEYTVTVDAGLTATDGAVLSEPFSWSFSTQPPQIVEVYPEDTALDVPLDRVITVTFNQPMNRQSVENSFTLRLQGAAGDRTDGEFAWTEDSTEVTFAPTGWLRLDSLYEVTFVEPLPTSTGGGRPVQGQLSHSFYTLPLPAITSTQPDNGGLLANPEEGFRVNFSTRMNEETLADKVIFDPPLPEGRKPRFYYYTSSVQMSTRLEAETTYTVTILPGMEDIYGNVIDETTIVTFTTGAFPSQAWVQAPHPVGFYSAYNEQTHFFVTHRNVEQIDVELYEIPFEQRLRREVDPLEIYEAPGDLLRAWSVDTTDTPRNTWQWRLLNVSDPGANAAVECPDAPNPRLKVGDVAVVALDGDPLRARALPPDGEIVELLYRDYALPITGGPVCANGLIWWEVELRDQNRAWVAEGDTSEYYLQPQTIAETTPITLTDETDGALPPGIYYLTLRTPPHPEFGEAWMNDFFHVLVVGTANLTMKHSHSSVLVWATDLDTGGVIADVPITVYDRNYNNIGTGVTDVDGVMRLNVEPGTEPYYAVLQTDDHFSLVRSHWDDGIGPWNFGHRYRYNPVNYEVYMYSDRPIYRPDQPVYFRGIIRAKDDVTYTPPTFSTVNVQAVDRDDNIIYEDTLTLTPYGTFSGSFDLAAEAPLGGYSIRVVRPPDATGWGDYLERLSFLVAEYRPPEFEVNVTSDQDEYVQGETIRAVVDSRFFFGGAVTEADVTYNVITNRHFFDFTGQGRYSFIDYNYDSGPGEFYGTSSNRIAEGGGTTDDQGIYVIEFPADLQDATQSQVFTIEAVVTDESGQAVAGRTSVTVHKGLLYIGVRSTSYVSRVGDETSFNLIATDWESTSIPNQVIDVEVVERLWSSVQEEDEFGRTTWTWEVEEIPAGGGSVVTDENGRATFSFTPPNGGVFKLKATTRDSAGNEVLSADTIWITSSEYVAWRQQNSNRIDLIVDSDSYNVGDTAEILITSPFQGTTEALITVERGDILDTERVTMESNSYLYELPITPDLAPNAYVSVYLVKGVDVTNPVAAFRMGVIEIGIDNSQKELTIEVETDTEQAGPGDTVSYSVRTTDYKGDPVQSEVGVGLTDLAVLSIGEPNSGPILNAFYAQQSLGVLTATPLTISTDQMTQTTLDTIKGGGGGFGEGGIFDIREEFVDTPYWNAEVTTDASGVATFEVTLPDNLTTWRLDARAVTSGTDGLTLVGQTTSDLLSTKPVLIRPVTPRFLVVGDEVSLAAIVNNNSPDDLDVAVTLQAEGVTLYSDTTQTHTIPAGSRRRVDWRATVHDVEHLDLTFFAQGGSYTDASKPPLGQGDERLLPVYNYEVPEVVGTAGVLREGGSITEAIALPRQFDVSGGELNIELESSLAATTLDGLDFLRAYPHHCTEQTVSRFLPNIMTYRALTSFGISDPVLEAELDVAVSFALQRLISDQKVDGGWGWFARDDSNPLTTAYALIGLVEARDQGYSVNPQLIANAQAFLRDRPFLVLDATPSHELNLQAFVLYALARSGAPEVGRMANLYEVRDRLNVYAKAYLALGLHLANPDDTSRTDVLLSDLLNSAVVSATGTHWENDSDYRNWNTDTRTSAIALAALIKLRPDSDLIPPVVRYLIAQRTADSWETTQETAWAVMALTDWMVASGELDGAYDFTVALNDDALADSAVTPANIRDSLDLRVAVSELLADEINRLQIDRTDGAGSLYYTAHLTVNLPVPEIDSLDRGIIVERRYSLLDDPEAQSISGARVGDTVQVRLTIIVPNSLHYVVIEDPIPAGTDAVNPDLVTSQQIGTRPALEQQNPRAYGWGWWWFSNIEFRDEKVVLYSTYLPAGTYEYVYTIRAGLPGVYNVIPAVATEFYHPEVYGRNAGSIFTILPPS